MMIRVVMFSAIFFAAASVPAAERKQGTMVGD